MQMSESQFLQEAGIGGAHTGESRNTAAQREYRALARFLRSRELYNVADVVDALARRDEVLAANQMPFGV